MSIIGGIAGRRGKNPVGIFLHNDAAGAGATTAHYRRWLPTHNPAAGFAHYYVCSDGILQAEDDGNMAWHCGNPDGNANYLGIEICQSMGDLTTFLANEEQAIQLAAQKCKQYGITPSEHTIKLHQEVYSTACPHRSVEVHGGRTSTKQYFISRIKAAMAGGSVGWIKDGVGWWYRHADGGYTRNGWEQIGGSWYYFDGKGYAVAGQWIKHKERWYYLQDNCKMATGWVLVVGKWYFMDSTGAMQTGWVQYGGKWYYLNPVQKDGLPEGAMMTGPVEVKGILYNLGNDGALEWEIDLKGGILKAVAEKKWAIEQPEEKDK